MRRISRPSHTNRTAGVNKGVSMKKQGAKKKAGGASKKVGAEKRVGTVKKVGAPNEAGGASLSSRLSSLTVGLSYQSESDYPVEPYVREASKGEPSAKEFAAGREGEDAAV